VIALPTNRAIVPQEENTFRGRSRMTDTVEDKTRQDVWQTLQSLNRAWTTGKVDELKNYFHENMVAITPVDRQRREGRQACIDGWAQFVAGTTKIHHWKELDPQIQIYGETAVVTYYFDMSFDMAGKTIVSTGRDMFVFVKEGGRWWAVADQFSAYPE
jgi:ketosteroid isomerase-like protein